MEALKKRSVAAVIAAAVIIAGTLLGVRLSVNRETEKLSTQFYKGVYLAEEKYTQPSIQSQLDKRSTAALGFLAVASNYPELDAQTKALRDARESLDKAGTPVAKYQANAALQSAYETLYSALLLYDLKDNEKASTASYAETMDGAQGIIGHSAYNSAVADYMRSLKTFPVNILKNLAFVKYPEFYEAEGS